MSNVLAGNKTKNKNTTGLIDQYIQKDQSITPNSNKWQSNVLSPPDEEKLKAKNMVTMKSLNDAAEHAQVYPSDEEKSKGKRKTQKSLEEQTECDGQDLSLSNSTEDEKQKSKKKQGDIQKEHVEYKEQHTCKDSNEELKGIIGSLVEEMTCLRETVHYDITDLQDAVSKQKMDISKLEETLSDSQKEIRNYLTDKIEVNAKNIDLVLEANKILRRENDKLKERITQIEKSQLENNIMISGQLEQPWESYELTKERVLDMIAAFLGSTDMELARRTARNTEISSCRRIGRYKMGRSRLILVTFPKKAWQTKIIGE